MPSQLVKCAFCYRSFNGPKAKCVPLSLELGSEQGARAPGATTVYKAGLSTVGDLYNLVTKIITNYPVLTTFKILKITKKTSPIFFVILRILKVVRTG